MPRAPRPTPTPPTDTWLCHVAPELRLGAALQAYHAASGGYPPATPALVLELADAIAAGRGEALLAEMLAGGYRLPFGGRAIKCLRCRMVSTHPEDVARRYCGWCHAFHPPDPAADLTLGASAEAGAEDDLREA